MYSNSKIAKAVRVAMMFGAGTAAAISAPAFSAEEKAEAIEKIEVTGSRIKRADMETAQPVAIIDRATLEASGLTSVGDFLQSLPIAGSAINTTFNNGGDGSTRIDLRNLGSSRVLVLVNGHRWINSGTGAVYGSDAIAGVVNVITRTDFEGVEFNAYTGQSAEGDGGQQQFDITTGVSNDKGHLTLNVSYTNQEPIFAGDREISEDPFFGSGNRLGSSGTPQGRFAFVDYDPNTSNYAGFVNHSVTKGFPTNGQVPNRPFLADGSANPDSDFTSFSNDIRYNYAPENYLLTPQDRWSLYVSSGYEIADDVQLTADVLYNHRESGQLLAPMPLFIGPWAGGAEALNPTVVSGQNIYNPFGYDIFGADHMDYYNGGFIGRRLIENGPRLFSQEVETWKFNLSLDGIVEVVGNEWNWSLHAGYGDNRATSTTQGRINKTRLSYALSAECNSDPSCVPFNLFGGEGSITDEMLGYMTSTETSEGGNTLWNYSANLSGIAFEMPAGEVGVSFGYEYRRENGFNRPDYLVQSGQSSGGSVQPTEGGFSESSYYMEAQVPLLADVDFAQQVDLSVAIRRTNIENTVGVENDNTSSSLGLTWRVDDDLLFRGNFSTGFRAPSVSNLFGGLSTGFPSVTDPCNSDGSGNEVCAGVPSGYSQPNTQLEAQSGSNEALEPEESESTSFGLVYDASWLEGFNLSVDVWSIQIDNVITSAGFQQVLNTCSPTATGDDATHPIAPFCDSLLQRAASGVPVTFINPLLNSGTLETNGVDFDVIYNFETSYGDINLTWDATYTDTYRLVNDQGVAQSNQAGRNLGDAGFPRWKSSVNATWNIDDFSLVYNIQYIGEQEESCAVGFVSTDTWRCSDPDGEFNTLDATVYHDMQASYYLDEYNTRFTLGVNNMFDKTPPISTTAFANSFDASLYDPTGRFFYGRVSVKF